MPENSSISDDKLSLKDVVVLITLLLNISALVWGAATLAATVRNLTVTVAQLSSTVDTLTDKIAGIQIDYGTRIRVLEEKLNSIRVPNGGMQ